MRPCDHTSVGVLVWKQSRLLLINRKLPPPGLAPPAGHVDDHGSFEDAAIAELYEEVGLHAKALTLIFEVTLTNRCRRPNGTWHQWKVFEASVSDFKLNRSTREVRGVRWLSVRQITEALQAQPELFDPAWFTIFGEIGDYLERHISS